MTPVEILHGARALIENPARWTRGTLQTKSWNDPDCAFCAMGAIDRASEHASTSDWCHAVSLLACAAIGEGHYRDEVFKWNDSIGHTHAEVLAAFDRAVALAETEGAE